MAVANPTIYEHSAHLRRSEQRHHGLTRESQVTQCSRLFELPADKPEWSKQSPFLANIDARDRVDIRSESSLIGDVITKRISIGDGDGSGQH
jgi:hypothetical protein